MSKLQEMQAAIAAMSETAKDMTEVTTGGGGGRLLPQGYAFGRLVEVIELGKQPQEFNGKAKDPKDMVRLGFALWGEGYTNEDGTPYILRLFPFSIDTNEKAKAYLLFKLLNWKGTAKNFGQLLGEAFLVQIVHEQKSKTDKTIVSRANLKGFLPPLDPVTRQPYPIPEATEDLFTYFFWDQPTKETWDSLYIEGNLEDGRSKNFVQEQIAGATNFAGSALEALLLSNGLTRPLAAPQPAQAAAASPALPNVAAASPVLPASTLPNVGAPVQGNPFAAVGAATQANTTASAPIAVGGVQGAGVINPLAQAPQTSAPVVPLSTPAPVIVGTPVLPVINQVTSPSNPVLPQ